MGSISADLMTSSTEQTAPIDSTSAMDTSAHTEEKPTNGTTELASPSEEKVEKRRRPSKKVVTTEDTASSIANGRPKRTLSKREEVPISVANGAAKASKAKAARNSTEQTAGDADDEQDRDKNIPILFEEAQVVWVKMSGHPWWPSLVVRDPSDAGDGFTKIIGNARPKRMYFVVFYGSTADFAWVSDAAMIMYGGVEAFTKYAQESVDKAQTKSQKEQLTERLQLKVTIGRREDWETAVREADGALKQPSEKRLQDIGHKLQFYTDKFVTPKGASGRRTKSSVGKQEDVSVSAARSSLNPMDRSLLAEKTFEFKSEDENDSSMDTPLRKPSSVPTKLQNRASNGATESTRTPTAKRPAIRKSVQADQKPASAPVTTVFGQTANGSSVSYQRRQASANTMSTPVESDSIELVNGSSSSKKRGRARAKQPSASSSAEDSPTPEFHSASPTVTTKFTTQRKPIIKPLAFSHSSKNTISDGKPDIQTGFLSPFEEQEVLDALNQLRSTKTFAEAEQEAKRRFEHILCLNLNRTHVDVPEEWFYTFLFSHPSLIMKNPQWFTEKNDSDTLHEDGSLTDAQASSSLAVLKHQLVVLSKLYRKELQAREPSPTKQQRSKGSNVGKRKSPGKSHREELTN